MKFAKQAWVQIETGFQNRRAPTAEKDDTVEAQAQSFRIWMWSSAAALSLILIASVISMSNQKASPSEDSPLEPASSMVDKLPDGYLIAPIEPVNLDSLDSIFEQHGYVDLYRSEEHGGSGRSGRGSLIARGLPLIRAPKNPRRFAVLVPEESAVILPELNEPVLVILRRKPLKKTESAIYPEPKKRSRASPLLRESAPDSGQKIDLIEESLPEFRDSARQEIRTGVYT